MSDQSNTGAKPTPASEEARHIEGAAQALKTKVERETTPGTGEGVGDIDQSKTSTPSTADHPSSTGEAQD